MGFWKQLPAIAALLALAVSAACSREPARTDESAAVATAPAGQTTATTDTDWWTTTKVQAKFFADSAVKGRNIDVDTHNGVVTLRGRVDDAAAKQRAAALAREVDGVTRVDDQLTVQATAAGAESTPTATSGRVADAVNSGWITTKIQAQYFANPDIKPWNVDVTTSPDGRVTLRGAVDDANDKTKAVEIARGTEGVTAVDDRLRVRGENERETASPDLDMPDGAEPDAWVTAKIQSKYFIDDDVKGRNINVTTDNGVVTLAGTVESQASRSQAVALARSTEGVKEVRDNLKVQAAGAATKPIEPVNQPDADRPDAWITTKIQSRYFIDPDVKMLAVNVDTKNGVVTLSGQVATDHDRQAAERAAKDTVGVKRVVNYIKVVGPGAR